MCPRSEVRAMGRDTMGVRGMTVPPMLKRAGHGNSAPGTDLFVITEKGYGKRTPVSRSTRSIIAAAKGVYTITMTAKKGLLSAMKIVEANDEIMIITEEGVVVRTPVSGVSAAGTLHSGRSCDECCWQGQGFCCGHFHYHRKKIL